MDQATAIPTALTEVSAGCMFRVLRVNAVGDDSARLKAMGVCVGRRLLLVQSGNPLIVRVVGSRVGISERLAETVYVERENCSVEELPQ